MKCIKRLYWKIMRRKLYSFPWPLFIFKFHGSISLQGLNLVLGIFDTYIFRFDCLHILKSLRGNCYLHKFTRFVELFDFTFKRLRFGCVYSYNLRTGFNISAYNSRSCLLAVYSMDISVLGLEFWISIRI